MASSPLPTQGPSAWGCALCLGMYFLRPLQLTGHHPQEAFPDHRPPPGLPLDLCPPPPKGRSRLESVRSLAWRCLLLDAPGRQQSRPLKPPPLSRGPSPGAGPHRASRRLFTERAPARPGRATGSLPAPRHSSCLGWSQFPPGGGCTHPSTARDGFHTCQGRGAGTPPTPGGAPPERKARGGPAEGRRGPQGLPVGRPRGGLDGRGGRAGEGEVLTCGSRLRGPGLGTPGRLCALRPRPRPRHASGPGSATSGPRFRYPPEVRGSEKPRGDSAPSSRDWEALQRTLVSGGG